MSDTPTSVGSIVGYLRLDRSDWDAELTAAGVKAKELSKNSPNINIKTNAADAILQLQSVAVASGRLQSAQERVAAAQAKLNALENQEGVSANRLTNAKNTLAKATRAEEIAQIQLAAAYAKVDKEQQAAADSATKAKTAAKDANDKGFNPLLATLGLFGPAVVPLAALGAAGFGAAALGAGALAAAVAGAATEMANGTSVGLQYTNGLGTLQNDLAKLEKTAAIQTVGDFNQAVKEAGQLLPGLNNEVGLFASIMGKDAVDAAHGLAGGFVTLEPLFDELGMQSESLFASFDKYANGGGLAKFESWVQVNLPTVEHDIGDIATAIAKVTAAAGPMGITSLNSFTLIARAINSLPLSVMQTLVPLLVDGYVAFQAYKGIDSIVDTVGPAFTRITTAVKANSLALDDAAISAKGAAVAEETAGFSMDAALGPIGAVAIGIGLLTATFLSSNKATQAAQQTMDSYAQAIQQDGGKVGDATKQVVAQNLAQSGATATAQKYGISLSLVASAAEGQAGAQNKLASAANDAEGALASQVDAGKISNKTFSDGVDALQALKQATQDQANGIGGQIKLTQQQTAALAALDDTTDDLNTAINDQAALLGIASDTATNYVRILGASRLSTAQAANEIAVMTGIERTADTAAQGLITAMDNFSNSTGTSADKATLLGAVLVASQGDMLSYTGAMAGSFAATQNLLSGWDKAEKSAVVLKTRTEDINGVMTTLTAGSIDYTQAGAGPLIQSLQGMQSAASTAAQALYQHELSTKGDSAALSDAQALFESMTNGTLISNAKQLGLTSAQATALASSYFAVPKNLTTDVQSIGLNDINQTLIGIGQELADLTGKPFNISVTADTSKASAAIRALYNLNGVVSVEPLALQSGKLGQGIGANAAGGFIRGAGTGTSDSILRWLSNGEFVMNAQQTAKFRPLLEAMNAGLPLPASVSTAPIVASLPATASVSGTPTDGASPSGPCVVNIYDRDNVLVGTMRGVVAASNRSQQFLAGTSARADT